MTNSIQSNILSTLHPSNPVTHHNPAFSDCNNEIQILRDNPCSRNLSLIFKNQSDWHQKYSDLVIQNVKNKPKKLESTLFLSQNGFLHTLCRDSLISQITDTDVLASFKKYEHLLGILALLKVREIQYLERTNAPSEKIAQVVKLFHEYGKTINSSPDEQLFYFPNFSDIRPGNLLKVHNTIYPLLSKIGQGSYKDVYYAIDIVFQRVVAIAKPRITDEQSNITLEGQTLSRSLEMTTIDKKSLSKRLTQVNEDFNKEFEYSVKFTRLTIPFILKIFKIGSYYGKHGETKFLVSELCTNTTLDARIKQNEKLTAEELILFATQIATSLSKLHDVGYVHEDIKPRNIFLTKNSSNALEIRIGDLGSICRIGEKVSTRTAAYRSSCDLEFAFPHHDAFSFGCTLYEMRYQKHFQDKFLWRSELRCNDPFDELIRDLTNDDSSTRCTVHEALEILQRLIPVKEKK